MRKSIATVSLSGSLPEKLSAAAATGFDGVEIFENDLIACPLPPREIGRMAADLGLSIDLYQPLRDLEAVPEAVFAAGLRRAEGAFTMMDELGASLALVCSSVDPLAIDDDSLACEQLCRLADRAAEHGIAIAYEALAWGRHVNDYLHAWKIVEAAGHAALGLCLDSFHILSRDTDPSGIRAIPADKLLFLQLADAPRLHMDVLQWSRHYRCFPGQGGFDLAGFTAHVLAAGYQGPLSLEVFNDVFRQADTERTAVDGMRSLIALEDGLHTLLPDRADLTPLPAAAPPTGFAFAELTVDPLARLAVRDLLTALGFTEVGRHRTKPVQLWRTGDTDLIVNSDLAAEVHRRRGHASLTALGIRHDDPVAAGRRAAALQAPAHPRITGQGERTLPAYAAPDRTALLLCPSDGGWHDDFTPLGDAAEGLGITHIDHIALAQPTGQFEESLLFHRTVLGLTDGDDVQLTDPYGLVRSRALSTAAGTLRLVITMPLLGGDHLPETAGLQHIAFACTDIFDTAQRMADRGLPTLPIPDSYYRQLAARTTLAPAEVDRLRAHNILHDDNPDGAFRHFYTATLGHRVFFEIVQRTGTYTGYGAADTHIRMAAQYTATHPAPNHRQP